MLPHPKCGVLPLHYILEIYGERLILTEPLHSERNVLLLHHVPQRYTIANLRYTGATPLISRDNPVWRNDVTAHIVNLHFHLGLIYAVLPLVEKASISA